MLEILFIQRKICCVASQGGVLVVVIDNTPKVRSVTLKTSDPMTQEKIAAYIEASQKPAPAGGIVVADPNMPFLPLSDSCFSAFDARYSATFSNCNIFD